MEEKENTENTGMGKRKHSHDTKIVIKYYYETDPTEHVDALS